MHNNPKSTLRFVLNAGILHHPLGLAVRRAAGVGPGRQFAVRCYLPWVCRGLCREPKVWCGLFAQFAVRCVLPWAWMAPLPWATLCRVYLVGMSWAWTLSCAGHVGSRQNFLCRASAHGTGSTHGRDRFSGGVVPPPGKPPVSALDLDHVYEVLFRVQCVKARGHVVFFFFLMGLFVNVYPPLEWISWSFWTLPVPKNGTPSDRK
jgi:hypothetical protein